MKKLILAGDHLKILFSRLFSIIAHSNQSHYVLISYQSVFKVFSKYSLKGEFFD